jgi:hypothetical protein
MKLSTYSAGPTGTRTYAPGVNPPAHQRPVPVSAEQGKVVWAYTGAVTQGDAESIYNAEGEVTAGRLGGGGQAPRLREREREIKR